MTNPNDLFLSHGRRPKRARLAVGAVVLVAVAVGIVGLAAAGASGGPTYRTATAGAHTVAQSLHAVATIEPITQAEVSFPVSGTVATVDVAVGDTVTIGQQLASLDPASLQDTVDQKQAALDQAELTLERALNGEDVSGVIGGTGGTESTATPTATGASVTNTPTNTGGTGGGAANGDLAAAQQAVLDGQRRVDSAMVAANTALAAAGQICAALDVDEPDAGGDTTPPPEPQTAATAAAETALQTTDTADTTTTSEDPTTSTTEAPTTTSVPPTTSTTIPGDDQEADVTACRDALQAVLDAQTQVSAVQSALSDAADRLEALRNQVSAQSSGGATETPAANAGSSGPSSASSSGPSSHDLIAYQAAVDAGELQLRVAQQAVEQATIASPLAGTVVSIDLAVGDNVTAASDTATIVIQGTGGYEATTTLGVDELLDIEIGDPATVTPDGGGDPITGEIVSIGVAATTDTTATYPVVISLDTPDADGLRNGAVASIALVTGEAADTLAVPTSAINIDSGQHTVTLLDQDGNPTITQIEIGAIGQTWTEVTSGLTDGQTVVLADLDQPLPGAATSSSNSNQGGVQGGPGGGFTPPAGFGPPE